jgi:hypothetical protein
MLPSPLYEMVPAAPWLLQSGILARHDTMTAFRSVLETLSDQYISKEALNFLFKIGMVAGIAYLIYGGGDDLFVEIVYGTMSTALPYVMEWVASGAHRLTGR